MTSSNDYLNIIRSRNFISCINTHVLIGSKTYIDHIFTKNINNLHLYTFILKSKIIDHYGSLICFNRNADPHMFQSLNNLKQFNIKTYNEDK